MDGFASGRGILLWTENGKPDVVYEGEYANGKRNGHGVLITPDGQRIEGQWVNDRLLTAAGDAMAIPRLVRSGTAAHLLRRKLRVDHGTRGLAERRRRRDRGSRWSADRAQHDDR